MRYITATQLIYAGAGHVLKFRPGVCRLCGGFLLEGTPLKVESNFWTDENLSRRSDSKEQCTACLWVRKNRNLWSGQGTVVPSVPPKKKGSCTILLGRMSGNLLYQKRSQIFDALEESLKEIPNVIVVNWGSNKHVCLRANGYENYHRHSVKVVIANLHGSNLYRHIEIPVEKIPEIKSDFEALAEWLNRSAGHWKRLMQDPYTAFLYHLIRGGKQDE